MGEAYHTLIVQDTKFHVLRRYNNLKLIGFGVQGQVCSAEDSILGRRVAIKKLTRPFQMILDAKRTLREIKILRNIDPHPNIIKLLDVFTPQLEFRNLSEIYIVMELMAYSLDYVIPRVELKHEHISYIIYQLLCGLRHLHSAKIIHRDLKPCNIMVDLDSNLKILDFGLARSLDDSSNSNLTTYVVTRPYRAPELTLNLNYNGNVDIWSVGCIFGEMIKKKVIFLGSDNISQWNKITELLGSPSEDFIAKLEPAVRDAVRSRPNQEGETWESLFPNEDFPKHLALDPDLNATQARDLLSKMLVIDPSERCTIEGALKHPYLTFARLYDSSLSKSKPARPIPRDEFSEEYEESKYWPISKWKELVFNEIKDHQIKTQAHEDNVHG